MFTDLVCNPILKRNGGGSNIGSVLSPDKECLMKVVKFQKSPVTERLRPGRVGKMI